MECSYCQYPKIETKRREASPNPPVGLLKHHHWIGLRENLPGTIDFPLKIMGLSG
jgi:hypothetical protein